MKRTKLIGDVFHSVVPEGAAGPWSVGYSGHTNNSDFFAEGTRSGNLNHH